MKMLRTFFLSWICVLSSSWAAAPLCPQVLSNSNLSLLLTGLNQSKFSLWGEADGIMAVTHYQSGMSFARLDEMYSQTSRRFYPEVRAMLVHSAAMSRTPLEEVLTAFAMISDHQPSEARVILLDAAALKKTQEQSLAENVEQVLKLFDKAPKSIQPELRAILAHGALLSGRSIEDVSSIYNQIPHNQPPIFRAILTNALALRSDLSIGEILLDLRALNNHDGPEAQAILMHARIVRGVSVASIRESYLQTSERKWSVARASFVGASFGDSSLFMAIRGLYHGRR